MKAVQRKTTLVLLFVMLIGFSLVGFNHIVPVHAQVSSYSSLQGTTSLANAKLSISFTCSYAKNRAYGKVCVHTLAKAALTIKVRYCTGYYAVSSSLKGTSYADASGNKAWSWVPDTKCLGKAIAFATAQFGKQSTSNSVSFIVN